MDYAQYILEKSAELLAIDSPTGYTDEAAKWVEKEFQDLGFKTTRTVKGGVMIDLGGKDEQNPVVVILLRIYFSGYNTIMPD